MSQERWGAFSVKDHIDAAALAADVLLYDKLRLPVPDNAKEVGRWEREGWEPGLQRKRLDVLGDLAEPLQWNENRQQIWAQEMQRLREKGLKVNGFQVTSMVLAGELNLVSAYQSLAAFRADYPEETDPDQEAQTAFLMGQRFAVPKGDPEKALQKAVHLAKTPEFKEHRLAIYDWQEQIVEKKIPPKDAVAQMDEMLTKYNAIVEKAVKHVYWKYAFTVAGIGLSLAGNPANPFAAGGAMLGMVGFAKMGAKPEFYAGTYAPAAMWHDFENVRRPFWDWTKHS
jgi:hypothetical protein